MLLSLDSEVLLKHFPYRTETHSHGQRHFLQPDPRFFVHDYLQGKFGLEVQCSTRNEIADLESRNFALVFENLAPRENAVLDPHFSRVTNPQASAGESSSNQVKSTVTINTRPIVQGDKSPSDIKRLVFESAGQSRISLYTLKDGGYVQRNVFHAPNSFLEVSGIGGDGKLPLLRIGGRVSEFQYGCIIDAGIQSASEMVQHFSEFERKGRLPISFNWLKKESPSPIVVHLWPGGINFIGIEGVPQIYERLAMNFCPRNAIPTSLEW